MKRELPNWYKIKGYLHLTPPIDFTKNELLQSRIESETFVAKHAFYPLIHKIVIERKFKKGDLVKNGTEKRAHKHIDLKNGNKLKPTAKKRPLHYATHIDALILSYYSKLLSDIYYLKVAKNPELDAAITAYRSIIVNKETEEGKSSIHFAKEAFDLIKKKAEEWNGCCVLAFDLKSFFSTLDHKYLKQLWVKLLYESNSEKYDSNQLPKDHYNVFKLCTNFSYILLDDLRIFQKKRSKKSGFNESKLAHIRKTLGFKAFFESNEDFRNTIKKGELKIYKSPFYKSIGQKKVRIGIPQGLPISSILANLYMSEFDESIIDDWTMKKGYVYRRYSDDILIICKIEDMEQVKYYMEDKIKITKVEISTEKTEIFRFTIDDEFKRLTSFKFNQNTGIWVKNSPLNYLGFEFRGYNVAIKSTNLAKYYRRIISLVKRRAARVRKMNENNPLSPNAIFRNKLRKLYNQPLRNRDPEKFQRLGVKNKYIKKLIIDEKDIYQFTILKERKKKSQSNYISYVNRCCKIFEDQSFKKQIRKRKSIVHSAIQKHFYE